MINYDEYMNYVNSLAGTWNDVDGAYGAQCVDLINQVYEHFWNFRAWGNAIDFTRNSMPDGFVRYQKGETEPKVGDILVWKWSKFDQYGHVSICVEVNGNMIKSLDQNIDGTPNRGGVARYRTRDDTYLVSILRPPLTRQKYGWIKDETGWWYRNNDGTYPKNEWQLINNLWYYFNFSGYAVTGWQTIKYKNADHWFYFDPVLCHMISNGVFKLEWNGVKKLYVFDENGVLIQNGSYTVLVNADGSLKINNE